MPQRARLAPSTAVRPNGCWTQRETPRWVASRKSMRLRTATRVAPSMAVLASMVRPAFPPILVTSVFSGAAEAHRSVTTRKLPRTESHAADRRFASLGCVPAAATTTRARPRTRAIAVASRAPARRHRASTKEHPATMEQPARPARCVTTVRVEGLAPPSDRHAPKAAIAARASAHRATKLARAREPARDVRRTTIVAPVCVRTCVARAAPKAPRARPLRSAAKAIV